MKTAEADDERKIHLKVLIMSAELSGFYKPTDRTAVVRIFDSNRHLRKTYPQLQERLYLNIFEYVFDDISVERTAPDQLDKIIREDRLILFNENIAEKILDDVVS